MITTVSTGLIRKQNDKQLWSWNIDLMLDVTVFRNIAFKQNGSWSKSTIFRHKFLHGFWLQKTKHRKKNQTLILAYTCAFESIHTRIAWRICDNARTLWLNGSICS